MAAACSREVFTEGVRAGLYTWPTVTVLFLTQIAVDNGFGGVYGQQKADWMVDVVQQYFHDNADLQQYEVEDFISYLIDQEFDTVVDDGSLPQVSSSLLQMFSQWQQGALQQLQNTINTLTQKSGRVKVQPPPPSSDDSDEETQVMECDNSGPSVSRTQTSLAPLPVPQEEDEDGWTVVRRKK
ncbi:pre-rRNA-processing protein TSR2 homolog [Cynoglossus semilaevis]|uniref:pre-rRNA-processing protein TSR2 homolog n=1 Tax=Cynoglossus semilaevis TaxID=244447 RepID=UPI0004984346|nr:pre-rRNA-processing protein TSR2 homolog [Cynoglossus semilaevis]